MQLGSYVGNCVASDRRDRDRQFATWINRAHGARWLSLDHPSGPGTAGPGSPLTLSAHGMSTASPVLRTTMVFGLAAATASIKCVLVAGRSWEARVAATAVSALGDLRRRRR